MYVESDSAVLECQVITYIPPTMTWVKREENVATVILSNQRTSITFEYLRESLNGPTAISRLRLARLSTSDNGIHSCQVNAECTTVSSQLTINVQGN